MAQLQINIPVTFEFAAMLDIKENCINRLVQNVEGKFTEFTSYANAMSMYVHDNDTVSYSGITLTQNELILDASYVKIDGVNFFTSEDNYAHINANFITASQVNATHMTSDSEDVTITINNGLIKAQSKQNNSYIEIGVDNLGYMTLKYIDSNGNKKYELSPYTPFADELIAK